MLHLIIQYYAERDADRKRELDYCLRKNLADPRIAMVHDLQAESVPPDDIRTHPKYQASHSGQWLTFARAFQYANDHLSGHMVALANLDIFLSDEFSVNRLNYMSSRVVLALARWEFDDSTGRMWLDAAFEEKEMSVSQDMWVFKSPIEVEACDFRLGTIGCDHAIAHRLHASGYWPVNDCLRFRICHLDRCRGKCGSNTLKFHRQRPEIQSYAGSDGSMMVPMLRDQISLDAIAEKLGMEQFAKYRALLTMWNDNLRLRNLGER